MKEYKWNMKKPLILLLAVALMMTELPSVVYADTQVIQVDEVSEEVIDRASEEQPEGAAIEIIEDTMPEKTTAVSENEAVSENNVVQEDNPDSIGVMPDDLVITDISEIADTYDLSAYSLDGMERMVGARIPSSYDSRNVNGSSLVTPVRHQQATNLCWAFALSAAAESDAIKAGLYGSSANFVSPTHMAYFMYHHVTDPLGGTEGAGTEQSSTNNYLGNSAMATLELMGWQGAADESLVPFSGGNPSGISDSHAYTDIMHMTDAYWAAASDADSIKNLIMEHGAVTTNIRLTSGNINSNHAYIYNGSGSVSHAVTLVGWDDDYPRSNFNQVSPYDGSELQDGAWLVKDSYGTTGSNRDNGYFWISYQDSVFSGLESYDSNKAIAVDMESADNYDHNYQYDGSNGISLSLGSSSGIYAANIFEARGNNGGAEKIEAVSFATPSIGGKYSVQIYTDLAANTTNPASGDAAFSTPQTGDFTYAGIHTVKLSTPVTVEEGTRFSVVVRVTDGITYDDNTNTNVAKTNILIDKSYGSWAIHTAAPVEGRSFYSTSGTSWKDAAKENSAVMRVKAFTSDTASPDTVYTIEEEMVADFPDMEYTGSPLRPVPVIHYKEDLLISGVDFTASYGSNTSAGKDAGVVTIRGIGRYVTKTPIVKNFTITKRDINSEGITLSGYDNLTFDGNTQTPVIIKDRDAILPQGAYRITYANNRNAGKATVTIKGINNYTGTRKLSFTIAHRSINDSRITVNPVKDQAYSGKAIAVVPIIKDGNRRNLTLTNNQDFSIVYKNNIMPGVSEIEITGKGNYSGTKTITYNILPRNIAKLSMAKIKPQPYQGGIPVRPAVVLRDGTKELTDDIDFTTIYTNNTNVGTATVTIAGKEGTIYAGSTRVVEYEIAKVNLATGVTVKNFGDRSFTTKQEYEQDKMTLTLPNGTLLRKGVDYAVRYTNNTGIGTATMTISALSDNYTGTIIKTFKIVDTGVGKSINDYSDSKLVVSGFAYNREYMFDRALVNDDWSVDAIEPAITISYGGKQLVKGQDYKISYKNNTKVGTAKAVITAIAGSGYTGQREEEYYIIGNPIFVLGSPDRGYNVSEPKDVIYNGQKQTQRVNISYDYAMEGSGKARNDILKENRHFKVSYYDNINAGTASYEIEGINNYSGISKKYTFAIEPRDLSSLTITGNKNMTYTGGALTPDLHIKMGKGYLREGVDYDLTFTDNVQIGTAKATFTAREDNTNFIGTKTITFKIKPRSLNSLKAGSDITGVEDEVYDGTEKEPEPIVTCNGNPLPEDDYTVTYGKNIIGPGKNYVMIKARTVKQGGSGNFTGSKKIYYNILGKEIDVVSSYDGGEQSYTGKKIKPALDTIENVYGETLTQGTDYKISYHNNTNCGNEAYILLKGNGNYKGQTAKVYFTIVPCAVTAENSVISNIKPQKIGTKANVKPKFTVKVNKKKLKLGKDYTVTYSNNTKAGTGNIRIVFLGNYTGSLSKQFTIQ